MFNIFGNFENFEVTFEIYIEDELANKQTMQAPKEIIIVNFMQNVKQISMDRRPMRIKISRPEIIWDRFEQKQRVLTNEIEYCNNAMKVWEENKERR